MIDDLEPQSLPCVGDGYLATTCAETSARRMIEEMGEGEKERERDRKRCSHEKAMW